MVFIETPLDAAHEAKAFWVEPPEALMLASFKVSVSQVVIVPFVTAFVLSHSTEAHHIPAMESEEPTPRNCHVMMTKGMVFRYTWVYSKEDTMAHTRRPVVTS